MVSLDFSINNFNLNFKAKNIFYSFNRLSILPRGFGAFPQLEILDLTSNCLSEKSLPNNFYELSNFLFKYNLNMRSLKFLLFRAVYDQNFN